MTDRGQDVRSLVLLPSRLHKARTRGLDTEVQVTYLPIANRHTLAQLHNACIHRALGRHFVSHFTAAVMMIRTIAMAYNTYTHNYTTSDYPRNQSRKFHNRQLHALAPKTNQPNNDDDDPRFRFRFPKNQNISTFPHTKGTFEHLPPPMRNLRLTARGSVVSMWNCLLCETRERAEGRKKR
jgi:hypothetical protein